MGSEPNRVEITSFNGWTHPQWSPNDLANDIALIELPSPITFNDYIKPSCLPDMGDTADPDELVTATGWGKPSDNAGCISPVLRMVEDLPIITNAECNAVYGIAQAGVVCIDTTGGKGTCNGDSGGPLNMKFDVKDGAAGQKWKQIGVVSFGASAGCEVDTPLVSPELNTTETGSVPRLMPVKHPNIHQIFLMFYFFFFKNREKKKKKKKKKKS